MAGRLTPPLALLTALMESSWTLSHHLSLPTWYPAIYQLVKKTHQKKNNNYRHLFFSLNKSTPRFQVEKAHFSALSQLPPDPVPNSNALVALGHPWGLEDRQLHPSPLAP